jgi:pimeloyl-ACP methyl ester carboxylesterase
MSRKIKIARVLSALIVLTLFGALASCSEDLAEVSETIYVQRDKVKMPVYLRGNIESNTIILVVHGGPGGNGWEMQYGNYADQIEAKFGMAYWDQRGQGMAFGKFGDSGLSIDVMVEDLKAVILAIKSKYGDDTGIFLMGHSWGGTLGTAFMVKDDYQSMLKGWIEVDGAHDIPKLNKDAVSMFKVVASSQIGLNNHVSDWTGILNWANSIDTSNISHDQGGEINSNGGKVEEYLIEDGIITEGEATGIAAFSSPINLLTSFITGNSTSDKLNDEVESTSLSGQLSKITIPSLFLWGKYDFIVPLTLGRDAFNKVSSTEKEIVIFEKSGHSPMDNEPDLFADALINFVEKHK